MSHAAQDAPRLDPTRYPREYSLSVGTLVAGVAIGFGMAGLGLFGLIVVAPTLRQASQLLPLLSLLGLATLGAYLVALAFRSRARIDVDGIQVRGALTSRSLRRDEIQGFRRVTGQRAGKTWLLIPVQGSGRALGIPNSLKLDDEFQAWLATFHDLDDTLRAEEGVRLEAALAALDERYGPEAVRWLRLLKWPIQGGIAILFIGILFLDQYTWELAWVAAAWPWITVAVAWLLRPLWRFGTARRSGFTDVSFAIFGPGLLLMLYLTGWAHLVSWTPVVVLCAVGAALLAAAVWLLDPTSRDKPLVLAFAGCMLGAPYGYGAGLLVDVRLDRSSPDIHRLQVLGKHANSGRHTSYYLRVPAWGPMVEPEDVDVGRREYEQTAIGDTHCLGLMHGALGIQWYANWDCANAPR